MYIDNNFIIPVHMVLPWVPEIIFSFEGGRLRGEVRERGAKHREEKT